MPPPPLRGRIERERRYRQGEGKCKSKNHTHLHVAAVQPSCRQNFGEIRAISRKLGAAVRAQGQHRFTGSWGTIPSYRSIISIAASVCSAKRPRPVDTICTSGHFSWRRWRSRMRRLSKLSFTGGRPSDSSRRTSRFVNSVRPVRCDSSSSFQRMRAGMLRMRYSPSTKIASSFL